MIIVSDTSPIVALLMIGKIELLQELYLEVVVPTAVVAELKLLPAHGLDISFLEGPDSFISQRGVADSSAVNSYYSILDAGESEAIALAHELAADWLLIDERAGRLIAEREGLRVKGLAGILLDGKAEGLIPALRPLLDSLIQKGFYFSERLYNATLIAAGEM